MGASLPPINSSLLNSAPAFNVANEVCLILHSGQSNSEAVAQQAGSYPSSYPNVRGLAAASNLSASLSDVTWSNWTNSPSNFSLGRQGLSATLTNTLHEFAAKWQAAINAGTALPDLYCVHVPWSGEGIGSASDANTTNIISNGSNSGSATALWNVLAREQTIASTPLTIYDLAYFQQYLVRMAIRNLIKTTGKSVRFIGYVWVQGEQDSKVLANAQAYQREFGIILNSINAAAGTKVPLYPVLLRSNDGQAAGRFQFPSYINSAFQNLVAWQGNGSAVLDPWGTPGAVPITAAQLAAAGVTTGAQAQAYMIAQGQVHNPITAADYPVSQAATVGNAPPTGANAGTVQGNIYIWDGSTWGVHYSQAALNYFASMVFSRVTGGFSGPVLTPDLPSTNTVPSLNLFDPLGVAANAMNAASLATAATATANAAIGTATINAGNFLAATATNVILPAIAQIDAGTGTSQVFAVTRDATDKKKYFGFPAWTNAGKFKFLQLSSMLTDTLFGGVMVRGKGALAFGALLRVVPNATPANTFQSTGFNYLYVGIGHNSTDYAYTQTVTAGSGAGTASAAADGTSAAANTPKVVLYAFDSLAAVASYRILSVNVINTVTHPNFVSAGPASEIEVQFALENTGANGAIVVKYRAVGTTAWTTLYSYAIPAANTLGPELLSGGQGGLAFGIGNRSNSALMALIRISGITPVALE